MNVVFNGAERPAVEHFARRGGDAARGDFDDRFGGVVDFVKNGEQRFYGLGQAGELYGDFRNEAERAFGTNEQSGQIVAGCIKRRTAETDEFAGGKHNF